MKHETVRLMNVRVSGAAVLSSERAERQRYGAPSSTARAHGAATKRGLARTSSPEAAGRICERRARSMTHAPERPMFLTVKLRDVVDLEVQLSLDEGQDEATLRARDRELYLELSRAPTPAAAPQASRGREPLSADSLLSRLAALRARFGAPQVGERVARASACGLRPVLGPRQRWAPPSPAHASKAQAPIKVGLHRSDGARSWHLACSRGYAGRRAFHSCRCSAT